MKKLIRIIKEFVPIMGMLILIPFVSNDYLLTFLYIVIIVALLYISRKPHDISVLLLGFIAMIVSETLFVATQVEIFVRTSFFGYMPLWLPFLWAYAFVAIKRSIKILDH